MSENRHICTTIQLQDGGDGVRFTVRYRGTELPAFAIRYKGRPYAYINRCAHMQLELDLMPGRFFDAERHHLICATHGATYSARSGECIYGPCRGGRLTAIDVAELDCYVVLTDNEYQLAGV